MVNYYGFQLEWYNNFFLIYRTSQHQTRAIFLVDIQFQKDTLPNYAILSYLQYCKKYQIDLIIQKSLNPKYRIQSFQKYVNSYYALTVPQIFNVIDLFILYEDIMVGAENDILITPNAEDYFSYHKRVNNDITFSYGTQYSDPVQFFKIVLSNHFKREPKNTEILQYIHSDKLVKKILGFEDLDHIYVCFFNIIFNHRGSMVYDFQEFANFLDKIYSIDPTNNLILWDGFIQKRLQNVVVQNVVKNSFFNEIKKFSNSDILHQLSIYNHLNYTAKQIQDIVDNKDVQFIHFAGGGRQKQNVYKRFHRIKLVYSKYYGSTNEI